MSAAVTKTDPSADEGRLVVIGRVPLLLSSDEPLPANTLQVRDVYEAIGEMTRPGDDSPPVRAVIVQLDAVRSDPVGAAAGLRTLDRFARLILHTNHQPVTDGVTQAFDQVIANPIDADHLRSLTRIRLDVEEDDRMDDAGQTPIETSSTEHRPSSRAAAHANGALTNDDVASHDGDQAATPADREQRRETVADQRQQTTTEAMDEPTIAPTGLGDTDLVQAVLHDPNGLREMALQLIREQTGWEDLDLLEPGETADDELSHTIVRRDEHEFGRLITALASTSQLQHWADWLGHWLALDHSYRAHRTWAYRDSLTGAWNRRFCDHFLSRTIEKARQLRRPLPLMVFDIDDFKRYNDEFGHEAGDEILCEIVRLLESVIREDDRVCRIGGDEFVVVFSDLGEPREPGSSPPSSVRKIAQRFQDQVCQMRFPKLGMEAPGTLSISAGLATFPWDGYDAESLLRHADLLAMQSKRKGKNAITIGRGASPGDGHVEENGQSL